MGGELACLMRPVASPVIAVPYRLAATAWARKWVHAEITVRTAARRSWAEADACAREHRPTRAADGYRAGGGAGMSELKVSTIAFHDPFACFFHTSTYFPLSIGGLPNV